MASRPPPPPLPPPPPPPPPPPYAALRQFATDGECGANETNGGSTAEASQSHRTSLAGNSDAPASVAPATNPLWAKLSLRRKQLRSRGEKVKNRAGRRPVVNSGVRTDHTTTTSNSTLPAVDSVAGNKRAAPPTAVQDEIPDGVSFGSIAPNERKQRLEDAEVPFFLLKMSLMSSVFQRAQSSEATPTMKTTTHKQTRIGLKTRLRNSSL